MPSVGIGRAGEPVQKDDMPPMDGERAKARLERARLRMQRQPEPIQYLLVVFGLVLVLAGLVMLLAPGPAFVVLPLGLGLLSLKSDRAKRMADSVIDGAAWASRMSASTKLTIAAVALIVVGTGLWVWIAVR